RFPPGHFYSPLPDTRELGAEPRHSEVWPTTSRQTPGIDWRDADQVSLCRDVFGAQERLELPVEPVGPHDYFTGNDQYSSLDAWGWNELYVVRAFLAFNSAFRIELGAQYLLKHHPELVREAFPGMNDERHAHPGGGSLWIRRVA